MFRWSNMISSVMLTTDVHFCHLVLSAFSDENLCRFAESWCDVSWIGQVQA
jgi:hypothetical protein